MERDPKLFQPHHGTQIRPIPGEKPNSILKTLDISQQMRIVEKNTVQAHAAMTIMHRHHHPPLDINY